MPQTPLTKIVAGSQIAFEFGLRIAYSLVYGYFVYLVLQQFARDPSRLTLLLAITSEGISIITFLFSRIPKRQDYSPLSVFISILVSFHLLFIQLEPGIHLLPEAVGVALQSTSAIWVIFAKLSLGRSFGILPSDRGVMTRGAYKFVRHPIYFGYLIAQLGFLSVNFSVTNLAVYSAVWAGQIYRIIFEEKVLSEDPAYVEYKEKVRYRLIPGIF